MNYRRVSKKVPYRQNKPAKTGRTGRRFGGGLTHVGLCARTRARPLCAHVGLCARTRAKSYMGTQYARKITCMYAVTFVDQDLFLGRLTRGYRKVLPESMYAAG